jgi:glucose-6-phosphate isomerase
MSKLTSSKIWHELKAHHFSINNLKMRDIFDYDEDRFHKFHIEWEEFLFDYSKNRINYDTIAFLCDLARKSRLKFAIKNLFAGKKVNTTENRAAGHTALRNFTDEKIIIDNENVKNKIEKSRKKIKEVSEKIISGNWKGHTGKAIENVVNIGIGGSDLGVKMAYSALSEYQNRIKIHFVSNVDRRSMIPIMRDLNPETTIFIVCSKSFKTEETMANASVAINWMTRTGVSKTDLGKHFLAVSSAADECLRYGIPEENVFEIWDWVGGRFSLWSAVGLSLAIGIGYRNYEILLKGAEKADLHFAGSEFEQNIPVLLAMLELWYRNFFETNARSVILYNQDLKYFPAWISQVEMESLGKTISKNGEKIDYKSSGVIFGDVGTDAQHSFFQMLHQGSDMIPVDFIAFADYDVLDAQNQILLANFFTQSASLMKGKTRDEARSDLKKKGMNDDEIENILPHKTFPGNKPSNTIIAKRLTPENLGSLLSFYEHKTFVLGHLLGINPFDQMGVELGKELTPDILLELKNQKESTQFDSSTNNLINWTKNN